MPIRASQTQQAWVKTAPVKKDKAKAKPVDPAVAREAIFAPLRYFACRPMDSGDRIRMLERRFAVEDGMVEIDRAPSPVQDQWQGAGLMFSNGSRSGVRKPRKITARERERGFDEDFFSDSPIPMPVSRTVSEPAVGIRPKPRRPGIVEELVSIEDRAPADDDTMSQRSHRTHRSTRSHRSHHLPPESATEAKIDKTPLALPVSEPPKESAGEIDREPVKEFVRELVKELAREAQPPPPPIIEVTEEVGSVRSASPPLRSPFKLRQRSPARSEISTVSTQRLCRDCTDVRTPRVRKVCTGCRSPVPPSTVDLDETRSYRSASPPPPSVYRVRQRSPPRREYYQRTFTAPPETPRTPNPMQRSTTTYPSSSSYRFQSAIFQSKSRSNSNAYRDVYSKRGRDGSVGPASWASATSALSFE